MKNAGVIRRLALVATLFGSTVWAAGIVPKGKTIRLRTNTCVFFDLQETVGRDGAPSMWTVETVGVVPTPKSALGVIVDSWLVGGTVTGVTVTERGWNLDVEVADLAVKPKDSLAPLTLPALTNLLQAQVSRAIAQAIAKGVLPAGSTVPVVSADGLTSGEAWVTYAGSGATPVTPDTAEQRARADARAAAEKPEATGKP